MAINPEIRDQAYLFFVEEAPDLLQSIEAGLLALRQERNPATIHAMMRSAHSLKGGAASVGLEAIKTIAHRLESIFKALYSDRLEIDSRLESQLLQAYDCLRIPLAEQISQGSFDVEQALAAAEQILNPLEEQCQDAIVEMENFIPGSTDLGIDMAASIFEVDVAEGLAHLEQILEQPQDYEVAGELRAQAEVFLGFAELLNLSGFADIAQTVIEAIDRAPDQAVRLTQIALNNFQAGRNAVLSGDLVGGTVAAELQAFGTSDETILIQSENDRLLELESLSDEELTAELNAQLNEAELEAIVQQELVNQETETDFLLADKAQAIDLQFFQETIAQPPTSENRFELEAIFTDLTPSIDSSIEQSNHLSDEALLDEALLDGSLESLEASIAIDLESQQTDLEVPLVIHSEIQEIQSETQSEIQREELSETHSEISEETLLLTDERLEPEKSAAAIVNSTPAAVTVKMPSLPQSAAFTLAGGLSVRVDADRLERLNNLLGEVTINRNGLALQTDQTRMSLRELQNRFERIQSTIEQIRTLSDQMLIAPNYSAGGTAIYRQQATVGQSALRSTSTFSAPFKEFDSLEMDRYTTLYGSMQTLLEEMAQIEEAFEDIVLFNRQSEQSLEQHRKMLSQMQEDLMWARMLPLGDVLNRFPRILRDLSNAYSKPIDLFLSGTDLLIDKAVLEKLYDPLLHLLRNSFDHGIESVAVRRDRGKPDTGRIEIAAISRGRQMVIEVRDDGQGLDLDRIRQRAVELGLLTEAETATEAQLCEFIFAPGFSTAAQVSELSGRGVGLDVVREQIQALKGSVALRSTRAQGTTFILTLPLTLTITNLLIGLVNSRPIAFRSDGIREVMIPQPNQLIQTENGQCLQWQDQQVPIHRMADLLTYRCLVSELPPTRVLAAVPAPSDWQSPILIFKRDQQPIALQVDRLITEQEFVVKPFGAAIAPPDYTYGCTVLGDGMLVPVIDGQAFLEGLLAHSPTLPPTQPTPQFPEQTAPPTPIRQSRTTTVLVVDDALTSRRMLALSLERAGYRVLQARDGQEALEQLQQSQAIELIVCDIEMPNMNGFEFLTHRRQDANFIQIPTVMLTSRSNDKHRRLAMQLGANAYFTKPYLEQEFLQAIEELIGVGEERGE